MDSNDIKLKRKICDTREESEAYKTQTDKSDAMVYLSDYILLSSEIHELIYLLILIFQTCFYSFLSVLLYEIYLLSLFQ